MVSMLSVFDGSLEFRWGPDENEPLIVANQIDMMADQLASAELPMLAAREVVVDDMKYRFAAEVDLDFKKWKSRSPRTIKYYEDTGQSYSTILRKNDDLYNAVTDRESYEVTGNDMFINTATWPVYWHILDQGGTAGRGVPIPQRQFVGVSDRAQFMIVDIFDEWMAGNIQIIRPGASGIPMFRGAFGRIAGVAHRGPRRSIARVPLSGIDPDFFRNE